MVRSATRVDSEAMTAAGDELRAVGRAGVGVDNIDVAAASARGIAVFNSPAGNVNAAAEHTVALILALARQVPRGDAGLRAGEWRKKQLKGTELSGKTLGVVGLGKVGRIVTQVAQALGMEVAAFDPVLDAAAMQEAGVTRMETLDELLGRADWVTLHAPLSDATRAMIGARELGLMKAGARLVNVARGALVDEAALHEALVSGHLAGAALDVFAEEPRTDSPLFALDSVVVTPHLGAGTREAQVQVALDVSQSIVDCLCEGRISGAMNEAQLR
jgi:D-3-phosphoglycerate dehydrogenase